MNKKIGGLLTKLTSGLNPLVMMQLFKASKKFMTTHYVASPAQGMILNVVLGEQVYEGQGKQFVEVATKTPNAWYLQMSASDAANLRTCLDLDAAADPNAIIARLVNPDYLKQYEAIFASMDASFETNIRFDDMVKLVKGIIAHS